MATKPVQVFGRKGDSGTQKCLRFFKERGVQVHFRDLDESNMSRGELENCARSVGGIQALLDTEGKSFSKRGFAHMEFDAEEEMLADAGLIRIPIARAGNLVAVGLQNEVWKAMCAIV